MGFGTGDDVLVPSFTFVATQVTGLPGKYVKMEDTVRSFAAILDGEW